LLGRVGYSKYRYAFSTEYKVSIAIPLFSFGLGLQQALVLTKCHHAVGVAMGITNGSCVVEMIRVSSMIWKFLHSHPGISESWKRDTLVAWPTAGMNAAPKIPLRVLIRVETGAEQDGWPGVTCCMV